MLDGRRATKRERSSEDGAVEARAGTLDCFVQKPLAAKDMKREDSSEAASAVTLTPAILLQKANQECYTYPILCSQSAQSSQGGDDHYQNSLSRDMVNQESFSTPLLLDLSKQAAWESASKELDIEVANLLRSRESDTTLLRQSVSVLLAFIEAFVCLDPPASFKWLEETHLCHDWQQTRNVTRFVYFQNRSKSCDKSFPHKAMLPNVGSSRESIAVSSPKELYHIDVAWQAEGFLKGDATQSYYMRISESEELQPVTFQTDFSAYASESKVRL